MDASISGDAAVDGSFRRPPTPRHPFSPSHFNIIASLHQFHGNLFKLMSSHTFREVAIQIILKTPKFNEVLFNYSNLSLVPIKVCN